jgi:hypothetical protein
MVLYSPITLLFALDSITQSIIRKFWHLLSIILPLRFVSFCELREDFRNIQVMYHLKSKDRTL